MKRRDLLGMLFLVAAVGAPLAAAPIPGLGAEDASCTYKQAAEYLQANSDHHVTGNRSLVDDSILLIRLEASFVNGERIYFEVLQEGERRLLEEMVVQTDDLAAALALEAPTFDHPVLELLGGDPGLRAHLRALAAQSEDIRGVVHVDGQVVADRAFADIVAASDPLRTDGPVPLATERAGAGSRTMRSAAWRGGPLPPAKSCQSTCDAVVDNCYDECVFTPGGGSSCFAACDAEYDDCLDACNGGGGGGGCNPSSTSTTQDSVVSRTPVGPIRCLRAPFPFNVEDDYMRFRERNRRVTTTTATHADCSQTTSSTTSFFPTFCWIRQRPGCSAPRSFGIFCNL